MTEPENNLPNVVSREEWLAERKKLLEKEKELTRQRDHLNAERRRLPMVEIEKDYLFEGPEEMLRLIDLFEGRRQLVVYHFMFDPSWDEGCPSCSAWVDHIARGHLAHLHTRGTTLVLVSRAPLKTIEPFKERMGWTVPWYSSYDSDFNYDFHVTLNESVAPVRYNYEAVKSPGPDQSVELPGLSCFVRNGDRVFHTYSTYARGTEQVGGANYFLDLTTLGRQEEWEEPKGRTTGRGAPAGSDRIRYLDEYDE